MPTDMPEAIARMVRDVQRLYRDAGVIAQMVEQHLTTAGFVVCGNVSGVFPAHCADEPPAVFRSMTTGGVGEATPPVSIGPLTNHKPRLRMGYGPGRADRRGPDRPLSKCPPSRRR